uniref:Uncharacterized protein n=1 Tax=viral metagenome TaxID=1070528 RepID=A0A6C0KIS3_9ZZZZ
MEIHGIPSDIMLRIKKDFLGLGEKWTHPNWKQPSSPSRNAIRENIMYQDFKIIQQYCYDENYTWFEYIEHQNKTNIYTHSIPLRITPNQVHNRSPIHNKNYYKKEEKRRLLFRSFEFDSLN